MIFHVTTAVASCKGRITEYVQSIFLLTLIAAVCMVGAVVSIVGVGGGVTASSVNVTGMLDLFENPAKSNATRSKV